MRKFWEAWDGLIIFFGALIFVGLAMFFISLVSQARGEFEPTSTDPCIAAMEVSASTFEDYKEYVELTSQNAVHAVEWDTEAMEKANSRINELGPDIATSFAHYEQLSEECKNG